MFVRLTKFLWILLIVTLISGILVVNSYAIEEVNISKITLDEIEKRVTLYFWEQANPENGLIKGRSTNSSPCNIAVVGFGLTALCVGASHNFLIILSKLLW